MKIEYITEQDVTGLGRIVVDGKFYGVPATAVAIIKLEAEAIRQQVKDADKRGDDALRRSLELEKQLDALKQAQGEPVMWTRCVFKGDPPAPFSDWNSWAGSPVKEGVTVRASVPEDWTSLQAKV